MTGAVVTGAVAGVLAAADGAAVVLKPGPGAVPWLAHPAASTARQAAAASTVADRAVVIVSALEPGNTFLQNPRLMRQDHKAAGPMVLMREA